MWNIRKEDDDYYEHVYGLYQELFCVKLHHGGVFTEFPDWVYSNGKVTYVDLINKDSFSVNELYEIVAQLGYGDGCTLYFHYLIPGDNLDFGLRPLTNKSNVVGMLKCLGGEPEISVYVEVGNSTVMLKNCHEESAKFGPVDMQVIDAAFENVLNEVMNPSNGYDCDNGDETDDVIVDPANLIEEGEVDMRGFMFYIENDDKGKQVEEVEESLDSDSFGSSSSGEDIEKTRKRKLRMIRKEAMSKSLLFFVGQEFPNKKVVKDLVKKHAVETRREISFYRNDQKKLRAVCKGSIPHFGDQSKALTIVDPSSSTTVGQKGQKEGGRKTVEKDNKCPWVLYASKLKDESTWVVKTYNPQHKCLQSRSVKAFTAGWLSNQILFKVQSNPTIPIKALQEQSQKKFEMGVSKMKAFRAKSYASKLLMGDYTSQYSSLREYGLELQRINPGTTVKLEFEPEHNVEADTRVFKRIYICLGSLKQGFKACRREILGLDGAFLKGPFPGQLLTAVGQDPNNGLYPVAYAIVESECLNSWEWFLLYLRDDLDLDVNSNFTFISDRQKGLIPALQNVFPFAEHRYCIRHIHQNMKTQWSGKAYKDMLWNIATASTIPEFNSKMEELRSMNQEAYQYLQQIPAKHWARSHFTGRARSDVLLNNGCEVFNSKVLDGRDKPVITALEFVREYLMRRIVNVMKTIDHTDGLLTPKATDKFEDIKKAAAKLSVQWNGGRHYQVTGYNVVLNEVEQCVVDVVGKTCSCRMWELTGIPCKHAIATNWNMSLNGQQVDIPEAWVDPCYRLETWKEVYSHKVGPINGRSLWPMSDCPIKIRKPYYHKPIGRPKKQRRKDANEKDGDMVKDGKLSRKGETVTCGKCGNKGHNKKTCKGQGGEGSTASKARKTKPKPANGSTSKVAKVAAGKGSTSKVSKAAVAKGSRKSKSKAT